MTKEDKLERLRRKKIAAKRKRIRLRRRAYALLLLCVIVGIAIIFYKAGKNSGSSTISENGIVTAGAGSVGATNSYGTTNTDTINGNLQVDESVGESYEGTDLRTPATLDLSSGNANVNLLEVEENGGDVISAAKNAMQNTAYFTGANNTVNNILLSIAPDGSWHAINTTDSKICTFFSGHHDNESLRVTFTLLNDGTFYLQDVRVDGENISDPIMYLKSFL